MVEQVPDPAKWSPLSELAIIADEVFDRWDKDMRAGKLMMALSGELPRYRHDVTSVRLACAVAPGLLGALKAVHTLARREGNFAEIDPEVMLKNIREFTSSEELERMFAEMAQTPSGDL